MWAAQVTHSKISCLWFYAVSQPSGSLASGCFAGDNLIIACDRSMSCASLMQLRTTQWTHKTRTFWCLRSIADVAFRRTITSMTRDVVVCQAIYSPSTWVLAKIIMRDWDIWIYGYWRRVEEKDLIQIFKMYKGFTNMDMITKDSNVKEY